MAPADDTISEGVAAMVILAPRLFAFDLGLAVLTVALWRARVIPAWAAPAGFLALVGDFAPTSYNAVIMNAVLIAGFAVVAWQTRPAPAPVAVPQPVG